MYFTRAFLLPLLALFITTVLAAPISAPSYSTNTLTIHPDHDSLLKRSPILFSSDRLSTVAKRAINFEEYSNLVAHDESGVFDARSLDDLADSPLAKREEGTTYVRLVKRKSLAKKIREAFSKIGKKIRKGFSKVKKAFKSAGRAIKKGFKKVKKAFKKAGRAMKKGLKNLGKKIRKGFSKVKKAFKKFGRTIKRVAKKAWKGIKKAAKKVGHFIKTTGAKIVKFGLKIYATATKIASKVAGLIIPGVGKAIGRVLDGASRVANLVSDKIHVSLGKKLDKGMRVMDRIQHPLKGAAGKALDAIFKRDLDETEYLYKRDLLSNEDLYERDVSELDARSLDDQDIFERDSELEELVARALWDDDV